MKRRSRSMSSSNNLGPDRYAERAVEVGGRLCAAPSELLIDTVFRQELDAQAVLYDALGLVDIAHTLVLKEAGVIPAQPGRKLLAALLELQQGPDNFVARPAVGDLYTNREAWLAQRTEAASWLGAGRARREATTTAFLIRLRDDLLDLADALIDSARGIAERAQNFATVTMPDYTYLLAAQPTTFGHYLLGFVYPMLRDLDRIRAAYGRVDLSPAGCGSSNGSRLAQNRQRLADLLGFAGPVSHGRDAMWQADLPIEIAALTTAILVNLDRLAEDLQIFGSEEFGLVELDDRHARASKIMPQKKNPFALTHLRGLANIMIGNLAAVAALGRTPSGQPDNRVAVYGLLPRTIGESCGAARLMGEVVRCLRFNAARAKTRLATGSALATDLAEVLVLEAGLDFREAHRLVGAWIREHGPSPGLCELTPENLAETAARVLRRRVELDEVSLGSALDPEAAIAARTEPGGAAPAPMGAMFEECAVLCDQAAAWTRERRQGIGRARESLLENAMRAATG
ncbi:MAG: fumarate lyase [Proteobacteria bacterium]|nr:fumarate lyase [Pseudomonadota bacterium]